MADVPQNITRTHLIKAIARIDEEGIPQNAHSSTYDLVHEGKPYPPKLVVSWANKFANNQELDRSTFYGGLKTDCFNLLEREGFDIVNKLERTTGTNVWLLSWNPEKWNAGGDGTAEYSIGAKVGQDISWRSHSKQPRIGDPVYLIRVGIDPKGIIAKGSVVQESHEEADIHDPKKQRNFIRFRVDELREACAEGLLPSCLLKAAIPEQDWSPQSSGISIKQAALRELDSLWEAGRDKTSLRQFVDWATLDKNFSKNDWLRNYQGYSEKTKQLKDSGEALDEELLQLIWKEPLNGIANVNPGPLSHLDYQQNVDALKSFTHQILAKADHETYLKVFEAFQKLKEQGSISKVYKAVINRVFAGLFPERFTTVVSETKCKKLLTTLQKDFQFDVPSAADWYETNLAIKQCMQEAGLDDELPHKNNIAMWLLYTMVHEPSPRASSQVADQEAAYLTTNITIGQSTMMPLNQILYGPPGTGKTYHTVDRALEILDPVFLKENQGVRPKLKARFDELAGQGRIFFVTFHQSFSYEDFVEGIKAITNGEGISYSVEPGIFKKACEVAGKKKGQLNVDEVLSRFIEDIAEQSVELKTPRGKVFTVSYKGGNTTITCVPHASEEKRELPASIEHIKQVLRGVRPENIYCESYVNGIASYLRAQLGATEQPFYPGQQFSGYRILEVSDELLRIEKPKGKILLYPISILYELKRLVESGELTIEDLKKSKWSEGINTDIDPFIVTGYYNVVPKMVEHLLGIGNHENPPADVAPVVLIIDEINRGNISSIFGELITLIEPSKRAGADEALSVTLPYSKELFQVPQSLYLIGTMNTADRSLALMDTALRRRFDFVEMKPQVDLLKEREVDGIKVDKMLEVMNKRIEVLYDREHTLGHAFFMPLLSINDQDQRFAMLQSIFANKILPLLEEYFFEDWEKIRLVLGDNQKPDREDQFVTENQNGFTTADLFGSNCEVDFDQTKTYSRNDAALARVSSYTAIYENQA